MKPFLLSTFAFPLLAWIATGAEKPNVLFLAIDDLRPELGCYGSEAVQSPHIDRFAESAVTFDRAYCQVAVCNPSRVSVMTGLRPDTSKVWDLITRFRHTIPETVTLPQQFMKHGYHTVSFGKIFHNPWPDNESWSEPHSWPKNSKLWSDDAKQRLADFRREMKADGKSDAAIQRMRAPATEIVDIPDEEHIDGAIAQQTIEAMRRLSKKDQPFFLAAGFVRPHLPFVVPRKYWDLYDRQKIPLARNNFLPRNSPEFAMNSMYELRDYMDYSHTADPRDGTLTEAQQRELKHGYLASVSLIDAQVGLILDELEKLGLADNTIVVLWSDHGWKLGEHNSWCKQSNYEIDARVPLIIRNPGAGANGKKTEALAELLDLYPTLCELAGVPRPDHIEGDSLVPVLNDAEETVKPAAFSQFKRRDGKRELMGYSMRTDHFRYVEWIDRKALKAVAFELYDQKSDPAESRNLAKDQEQKGRLAQLSDKLWSKLPPPPEYVATSAPKASRPVMRFHNQRNDTLTIYWLPEKGERKKVGVIKPGESSLQNTTMGHRFVVVGSKGNESKVFTVRKKNATINFNSSNSAPQKASVKAKPGAPNIVVIMGDDWSWPHASILGDPVVKTPAFDRIAREGVLFENAFVSAPSCTPSRFAVASGQYHWRLGEGDSLGGSLAADVPVYPDLLADTGYTTGFCRKGATPSKHTYRGSDPLGPRFRNFDEFMDQREEGSPVCFWYGAGEPHRPYDWTASRKSDLDLAAIEVPPCFPDNETIRTDLGDYYLKVQQLDRFAGEILQRLEDEGELENTIVVMTGDNGMPFPRCKGTLYDRGTRVPLAIRWGKEVKSGRKVSDYVSLTDLAPTFLEAAGLPVPAESTGQSLLPQLKSGKSGQIDAARRHALTGMEQHVYPWPSRAIRTPEFLYIRNFIPDDWPTGELKGRPRIYDFAKTPWPTEPGAFSFNTDPSPTMQWLRLNRNASTYRDVINPVFETRPHEELYDLKSDPHQLVNVATVPSHAETRNALAKELDARFRASGDPRYRLKNHATCSIRGWTVHINDVFWQEQPRVLEKAIDTLQLQLDRIIESLPEDKVRELRKVPLWMNPPYKGIRGRAEYHPEAGWLKRNGRDPAMVKAVEFTDIFVLPLENIRMPYVVLHELAHAYHDRVLGFDDPRILEAYRKAKAGGNYKRVKRWNGREFYMDEAYAITDHKEYFAETTEAYFGRNDYYPFNREQLKKHDPEMFKVLREIWEEE